MIVPRYLAGKWYGVVTQGSVALLAPEVDAGVVEALWACLRDGASVRSQLQVLLGLAELPAFALVTVDGDAVHAIARGGATVSVRTPAGERVVSGGRTLTWVEEVIGDAVAVRLTAPGGEGGDGSAPVVCAVVRASAIHLDLSSAGGVDADSARCEVEPVGEAGLEPVPEVEAGLEVEAGPEVEAGLEVELGPGVEAESSSVPGPVPGPEAGPVPGVGPVPGPVVAGIPAFFSVAGPVSAHLPTPAVPWSGVASLSGGGGSGGSSPADVEITVIVDPPVPDDLEPGDHDGMTVVASAGVGGGSASGGSAGLAGVGGSSVVARIVMCTGLVVPLGRPVLIGRAPQVSRVTGRELPRMVTVVSPNHDISRTHAQVRQDGEDVVVTDLHSTNGVFLRFENGEPQRLHPGDPTVVSAGVVVDLGDGVTFMVGRDG